MSGDLDHKPELPILLDLLADAEERTSPATLQRWLRAGGPHGRPIDLLTERDFTRFVVDRYGAIGFNYLTGVWPGQKRPDPEG